MQLIQIQQYQFTITIIIDRSSFNVEIRKYDIRDKAQIISLLSTEWNFNVELFNWKYEINPFSDKPYAYVCLNKGKIIGFRGFFEMNYQLENRLIKVLSPSDVFVSKDFRRKGIFSKMNSFALDDIKRSSISPIFLNLSSNEKSTPGYIKMGWKKAFQKNLFVYNNLPGLTKGRSIPFSLLNGYFASFIKKTNFDDFISIPNGKLIVSRKAYPKLMSNLWNKKNGKSKISLFKDVDFFKWVDKNPKGERFFFYNLHTNGSLLSYIIIKKFGNKRYFILDYEFTNYSHIEYLIKNVMNKCPSLYLMYVSYNSKLKSKLSKWGFIENTFAYNFFNYNIFSTPVLIRYKDEIQESDYYHKDLDFLSEDTWHINPINEDGN